MHRANRGTIENARMLTIEQAQAYTGMGRTSFTKWAREHGAVRKFGSMTRYDKVVIDRVFDEMQPAEA